MRGLRQLELEPLGEEDEGVKKAARQRHIVVDHQQPVVSLGWMLFEQGVEVFEFAEGAGHRAFEINLVARAIQLRSRGRQERGLTFALDRQREYSPARRSRGCRSQPRALQKRPGDRVAERVEREGRGRKPNP